MEDIKYNTTWEQDMQTLQMFVEMYNNMNDEDIKNTLKKCIMKTSESLTCRCCYIGISTI